MPILDTVVLFAAADARDERHGKAVEYMRRLKERGYLIAGFAMVEFDIVLKSRGLDSDERMRIHALLMKDYPEVKKKVAPVSPLVLYHTARLEKEGLEYFDAGVAAQALLLDGVVVTTDVELERAGARRIW
ncbi:TPA: type II toxin-antitoxin system VapC family toxin [Candidatus Bathyarchaeota archaeon]|nr:type II toxin-antitoxin system VapC family toxin [Candidatus Bathyarchaeota archaeon]